MKVLVIKTSSLGDVIHTLPALTDAAAAIPGVRFDWVVEEAFAEVPAWHPAVCRVIPIGLRRWRRAIRKALTEGELAAFLGDLRRERYDRVVDAQGLLIKSALVALLAQGVRCGFDRKSAREPLAALAYQRRYRISRRRHAIDRVRQLFARALGYSLGEGAPDYGISARARMGACDPPRLLFLHGTTWPSKHWPESFWVELARRAAAGGFEVRLPWGGREERARAGRIAEASGATILPGTSLSEMADELAAASGAVGVDTGLGHLAAALDVPAVTIFGSTSPELTGASGRWQRHLLPDFPCAPCLRRECDWRGESPVVPACYGTLPPDRIWSVLESLMRESVR